MRSDRSKKDSLNVLGKQELQAPAYSTNKNARPIGIDRKDLKKEMQKASEEVQSSNRRKHAQTEEPEEFYYEDLPRETTSKKSRRKKSDKTDKNKKNNGKSPKLKGVHLAGTIAMYVQAALSLFLFILLLLLDVLPWWLLTIAIIVVFAIWIAVLFLQMSKQKKKHIIGLIVSVVMCLLLGFGDYYLMLTNNMLNKITRNKDYDITTYNIVVRADDPATSLKDAAKYTYGIQIGFEPDNVFYVLDEIQKESGTEPTTKDYNSCTDQGKDLLDKKVDAIIYNDNFTSTIAEHIDGYDSKIKVLKQIKIQKKNDKINGNLDVDVTKEPFIVFISGNDEYGELNLQGRSDVNIMVVVNPTTRQCLLVTTPRDYYVKFPGITGESRDKLTHSGIYGTNVQLDTFKELYGYDINFYVKVNFSSVVEIIDAIGGVEVNVEIDFVSHDGIPYWAGWQTLDGFHALHYARERYAMPNGDADRARHQQDIIEAMINKLTSAASLSNYTALTDALDDAAVTNMPKESISAIIKDQLSRGGAWQIYKTQAEGEGMFQPSYAAGNEFLYVCMPYKASIDNVKAMIAEVIAGKEVKERSVGETGDHTLVADPISDSEGSGGGSGGGEETIYEETETTEYIESETTEGGGDEEGGGEEPTSEEPTEEETPSEDTESETEPPVETESDAA